MDTRQGWQGVKHGPARRRSNYCYQREKKRSVTGLGRAAAGVRLLRELVRPGNLL